jgi:hypothetical protein
MGSENRRKHDRLGIALPVRVQGHDVSDEPWEELTKCVDASEGGCSFLLKQGVLVGQVLRLELPLPRRFRTYETKATQYETYALVHSAHLEVGGTRVGVAFLGREAPPGYAEEPGRQFHAERRHGRRGDMAMRVSLASAGSEEKTLLENFGSGGARVMTGRPLGEGEVVTIEDADGSFKAKAEIRSVYVGKDGIRRLNLRFL